MNLIETVEVLGNFGEFFGAIAVFATLAYLTVKVDTVGGRLTTRYNRPLTTNFPIF